MDSLWVCDAENCFFWLSKQSAADVSCPKLNSKVGQKRDRLVDMFFLLWSLGCFTKTFCDEKMWLNPLCKYLGVALKESKRIFDFDKF